MSDWMLQLQFIYGDKPSEQGEQGGSYKPFLHNVDYHNMALLECPDLKVQLRLADGSDVLAWIKKNYLVDLTLRVEATDASFEKINLALGEPLSGTDQVEFFREFYVLFGKVDLNKTVKVSVLYSANTKTMWTQMIPLRNLLTSFKNLQSQGITIPVSR